MKIKIKNLFLYLLIFGATTIVKAQDASQYMDIMSEEFGKLQKDMWDYTSSVSHGKSARKVEKRRIELIQTSNQALQNVRNLKAFNNSTRYRDSIINYFYINNLVLKEDYAKIVNMEEIAEESYDAMEAYMLARDKANEKLQLANEVVKREQEIFAKENNINLIIVEDDLNKKMSIASDVYEVYNKIYLIFFKSLKQEVYLMDAIQRKDINAIEQNRMALIATSEEGLDKLKLLNLYKDDNSMVEATKKILAFYKDEAEKEMPKMIDFFLSNENYEKVKKGFDAIPQKKRKQEDIDTFNEAVNQMNSSVGIYNKTNDLLNKLREANINNWNKIADAFTNKHVPKGK